MNYFCHNTAIIDDGAIIGDGTKIWHFTHISKKANIGKKIMGKKISPNKKPVPFTNALQTKFSSNFYL